MENLVTLISFNFIHELAIIKGRLEADGIECFIKDEYTVTANPLYGPAIGGIKLQVKESDVESATKILIELGYLSEKDINLSTFWDLFQKYTGRLSFLKRITVFHRFLFLIILFSAVFVAIAYFIITPGIKDRLTDSIWCVDNVVFNQKTQKIKTTGLVLLFRDASENCENMIFSSRGDVSLPGINTDQVVGDWKLDKKTLLISNLDTLQNVYGGSFDIKLSGNTLILESPTTKIYAHGLR